MPELPEVETYARDLRVALVGRTLAGAYVDWPRQVPLNTVQDLDRRIAGQRVSAVARRGKYLVLQLTDDWLLVHLKMSGRLQVRPSGFDRGPWVHVVFMLVGGDELQFHDPRKFGRVYLVDDPETIVGELGPEPLADDFTPERFRAALRARRGRLKPLLLDQTFLAGLGNIYVDESLWQARLHPLRRADTLSGAEASRLYAAIRDVLARAIRARGSSLSRGGYRDLTGNQGEMQESLAVYGRTGRPCPRCATPIERLVVQARGTHVCRRCQPHERG